MEAKDTVISLGETTNESLRILMEKVLLEQAEVAYKAGIREVVEWGEIICMEHGMRKHRKCDKCWHSQLKEWGIE